MEYVIRDSALNWKHINTFQLPEAPAETRKGPDPNKFITGKITQFHLLN